MLNATSRRRVSRRASLCLSTVLASGLMSGLVAPAVAQEASIFPYPVRQYQDENGVDLLSGVFTTLSPGLGIGPADMGLSYVREVREGSFRDTVTAQIAVSGNVYTVAIGPRSEKFTLSGGVYIPQENNGSRLSLASGVYTYTAADGTIATFLQGGSYTVGNARENVIQTLKTPDGRQITYHYLVDSYDLGPFTTNYGRRLQGVTNNAGWQINLQYAADDLDGPTLADWSRIIAVKGLNSSVDSCAPAAFSCPQTGRPKLDITQPSSGITDYTDAEGRTTRFTLTAGRVTGVRYPGSAADDVSVTYTSGRVTSITRAGITTGYAVSDAGNIRTVTVTRPGGATRVVTFDIAKSVMTSDRDELNRTTAYQYDTNNRPTRITRPEGDYTQLTYDARGNVTTQRSVAKAGSGLADLISSATYPASCANAVTCNRPTTTTDARGNVTDYTYDATHGGTLSVTAPAAASGGNRPQLRTSYTRLDASGAASANGTFRQTGTPLCQTGVAPACLGTADEIKTTTVYGQGLLRASETKAAGDNSLTATSAMSYDVAGNLLTVDGPLAGSADTVRVRWNLNREVVGVIGPDPDGAGSRKHRATRASYASTGLVNLVETGTVNSQSDADWAAFAPSQGVATAYDANRRPVKSELKSGGTTYALSQTSYDALGRIDCVAQRMDPAQWAGQSNACTPQTTGPSGPDRVSKTIYNAASEVTQMQTAVGTADAANEVTSTYTANGRLATVKDGENNLTTYEHDGHDRLMKTRYPVATLGANASSTTDYEQLSYDANGNVTQRRLRDGLNIGYSYDNLDRLTYVHRSGAHVSDHDYARAYDLLGRLTSSYEIVHNRFVNLTYDALGRLTYEATNFSATSYQYDLAGRKTRLIWGDGVYVSYDYDVVGNTMAIRENGAASGIGVLATYAYDNLGRRTTLTRGNGTVTSWSYDPVGRLASLGHDLAGTASDVSTSFTYNPASQIASSTRNNDAHAWGGHYNRNTAETPNGLNQLVTQGSTSLTYSGRGNVAGIGSSSYGYNSQNQLTTAPGTEYLYYDVMGRLDHVVLPGYSSWTGFDYDGAALIAETQNNTTDILRRYVHGPGSDEPLVWYEGSGTSDRRWLHADERGSIVAVSDASGNAIALNKYDEYGNPQSGNLGRFGYTGQTWLPELQLWHYKARSYNPALGRFMQTDPIGYADGINWYAYVGNDPVNFTDPTGMRFDNEGGITVTGIRGRDDSSSVGGIGSGRSGFSFRFDGGGAGVYAHRNPVFGPAPAAANDGSEAEEIVVSCDAVCRARNLARDAQRKSVGQSFLCLGANVGIAGGYCRGGGKNYMYTGLAYPPGPDVAIGYAFYGAEQELTGTSASFVGFHGGSATIENGKPKFTSVMAGTPGVTLTRGMSTDSIRSRALDAWDQFAYWSYLKTRPKGWEY